MEKRFQIGLIVVVSICIGLVYRNLFFDTILISTDLPYVNSLTTSLFHLLPKAWDSQRGVGMGGIYTPFLWYFFVINLPSIVLANYIHIPWGITERVVLFFPFILIGAGSTFGYIYAKTKHLLTALLSIIIFLLNSYVLMLVSGGQMQILLSLSLIPLLLFLLESYLERKIMAPRLSALLFAGVFSIAGMYDIRIAFLGGLILSLLGLLYIYNSPKNIICLLILALESGGIFLLFHFFWILPTILHKSNPINDLGPAFSSAASVKFLSFATYEYPFSLLHPLWPNNIFGQVPFFFPLFLLIPLLAFLPMLFVDKSYQHTRAMIFGSLLVILGAFLAKGAAEPFGNIYLWIFAHIPGFELFRDSTKFYALIIIGYIMLIPLGFGLVVSKWKLSPKWQSILFLIYVFLFLIPITPGLVKGLPGVFKYRTNPTEYQEVNRVLDTDKTFSRVLWFPQIVPFAPVSNTHPGISAAEYFSIYAIPDLEKKMTSPQVEQLLRRSSVRYVILPSDVDKSIYVTDRKYSPHLYEHLKQTLDGLSYLTQKEKRGDLIIYETTSFMPHVSLDSEKKIQVIQDAFWQYRLTIPSYTSSDTLHFSESYDPGWELRNTKANQKVHAQKDGKSMSFSMQGMKGSEYVLFYAPESQVLIGFGISIVSICGYLVWIGYEVGRVRKQKKNK